jgi:hypothetical protein
MYSEKEFDLKKLHGDASTRSYFRMNFKDPRHIPSSLILMKKGEPVNEEDDDFLRVREFLSSCNVPVPSLYFVNAEKGFIYIQDCGDTLLEEAVVKGGADEIEKLYPTVIDILVTMQVGCTRNLTKEKPVYSAVTSRRFDTEKYMFELNHTAKWFIKGHLGKRLSPSDEKRLDETFRRLAGPLENEPMVFTHRDYHSRNIMVRKGRFFILDFQDAMMGPLQYDLASLLYDSYVRIEDDTRDKLVEYYLGRVGMTDGAEKGKFLQTLYRVALQRNLKALGTFGYQAVERKNRLYLQFVPATVAYIRTNLYKVSDIKDEAEWVMDLLKE